MDEEYSDYCDDANCCGFDVQRDRCPRQYGNPCANRDAWNHGQYDARKFTAIKERKGEFGMRQLLMTMLLIVTVVILYTNIAQGDEGTQGKITSSGDRMADQISRISP